VTSCSDGLRREAQALTDINLDFSDITNGLQQVSGWFKHIQDGIESKREYLQKHPKTQAFIGQLDNIWKQVSQLSKATNARITQVQQSTQAISRGMESLVPQSIIVNGKPIPIQFENDLDDPGYQKAVVHVDGQKYEVQEDNNGKRSLKKVEATPAAPAIGTTETAAQPIAEVHQQKTSTPQSQQPATNDMEAIADIRKLSDKHLSRSIKTMMQKLKNETFNKGETQQSVTRRLQQLDYVRKERNLAPVTASESFNLKMYKIASRK
jgi:hypothetical protein